MKYLKSKISAFYGFQNNIDPNIIGSIENICITKQWINGLKGELCDEEFKIKMGTVGSHLD